MIVTKYFEIKSLNGLLKKIVTVLLSLIKYSGERGNL